MNDQNKVPTLDEPEKYVFLHADGVIKNFQLTHKERVPKGIKMCTENAEQLKVALRKLSPSNNSEITHMRGSEIIIDDQLDLNDILAVD